MALTSSEKRVIAAGLAVTILMFTIIVVWGMLVKVDTFVVAPGKVVIKSYKKPIEYQKVSTVSKIFVKEGDFVEKGQPLIELENIDYSTDLSVLERQYYSLLAKRDRLLAEVYLKPQISFSKELLSWENGSLKREIIASEEKAFLTRKRALEDEINVVNRKLAVIRTKIEGTRNVLKEKQELLAFYREQIKKNRDLVEQGLTEDNELVNFEKLYKSTKADITSLESQIKDLQKQIEQLKAEKEKAISNYQKGAYNELEDVMLKLREIKPKINKASHYVKKTLLTAPVAGQVIGLKVHSSGEVVEPGNPIMFVVPKKDEFFILAKIEPKDRDRVKPGQKVDIQFSSYLTLTVGAIEGEVKYISSDTLANQKEKKEYYEAHIILTPKGKKELEKYKVKLVAGMPAVSYIHAEKVTPFEYMIQPLILLMKGAFRAS